MEKLAKPTLLVVLDGWGHREASDANAIAGARTPTWDRWWAQRPRTLIETSGNAVGLPDGQMGNSEVGHMNLGAGRVVYQDYTRITRAIATGEFATNQVLCDAVDAANAGGGTVHVLGLLSPGGVHSHEDHLLAMVDLAVQRGARAVAVHAFLDGRDTPPRSAAASIERLAGHCAATGVAHVASLCGRYYAMDRDNRWERIESAYRLIAEALAPHHAADAGAALAAAYARDESDEFVAPTRIGAATPVSDGDTVVFMNFRADRARELTRAFTESGFSGFARTRHPRLAAFVCLTQYQQDIDAAVAYPPADLREGLGEVIAGHGLGQLRIAETEKYAHVTFFFNGGRENPFPGEDRRLIPSPAVATYDLQPEMNAAEVTAQLADALASGRYALIVCNYANPDMVGHTGDYDAAVRAVEAIDACLARLEQAVEAAGGQMLVTADHGNVEQMADRGTGQPHTAHTTNPVPLVYLGPRALRLDDGGVLADVAPTLLQLMELPVPAAMTGRSLLRAAG